MEARQGDEELADRIFRATVGTGGTDRNDVISAVLEVVSEAVAETDDTPEEFASRLGRVGYIWFRST